MIMATVLRAVTEITVNIVFRSEFSFFGRTEEIARAADAPQIATAPPVNMPSRQPRPSKRDKAKPINIVRKTAAITMPITPMPNDIICSNVILRPRRATPN